MFTDGGGRRQFNFYSTSTKPSLGGLDVKESPAIYSLGLPHDRLACGWEHTVGRSLIKVIKNPDTGPTQMLIKDAEKGLGALIREYMHIQGSNCAQEIELKGRLKGVKDALKLARLVNDDRFQELFSEAHLEVFGMSRGAKSLAIGVAAQQLTMDDWEKFDTPTVMRRGPK